MANIPREAFRTHMHAQLLPLWDAHGWDRDHGGFHSRLAHDLSPVPDGFKRLVVQTRQLYVYARAGSAGLGWAGERADHVYAHVLSRFWDPKHGGWYLTTTPRGEPLDRSKDAYAHAFVLLGLAYYHRLRPGAGALERAAATLDLLERRLADRRHGGFQEGAHEDWSPRAAPRRHNPHMHLFEALLALFEVSRAPRFGDAARALLELFVERLYPAPYGGLPETFAPDWAPAADPPGAGPDVEPGHHFEWYWLLDRAAALGIARAPAELAEALFAFAQRHGTDSADGAVFDCLAPDGSVRRDHKRVWPQTEYLKALALRAAGGRDPEAAARLERTLALCRERYIDPSHGGWYEHVDRSGAPISDAMNATTVYHVVTAFDELLRD